VPLELVPLGTITIGIKQHTVIGGIAAGSRIVGEAADCVWEGDRVQARQWGDASSDWLIQHPDGTVSVDARLLFVTADGAHIAMMYRGRAAAAPITGAAVYTTPTFETDDPRYAWLNGVQAVAKGLRVGSVLTYELYELR
jgi:Protein of unknown function (DUF3237)